MTNLNPSWVQPCVLEQPGVARTIRLEPLEARHAPDLLDAADPELFRHTMQAPPEWSVRGFEREIASVCALPGVVALAIVMREGPLRGRAIGRTTFMDIRPEHRGLEVGRTWIGRAHQRSRVNPEAKYLMLHHAFETLSPTAVRVQLCTGGTNLQSQHAIEKLGAIREGVHRQARILSCSLPGAVPVVTDTVVFSILDREWPGVRARLLERVSGSA